MYHFHRRNQCQSVYPHYSSSDFSNNCGVEIQNRFQNPDHWNYSMPAKFIDSRKQPNSLSLFDRILNIKAILQIFAQTPNSIKSKLFPKKKGYILAIKIFQYICAHL